MKVKNMQGLNQELEIDDEITVDELKSQLETQANIPKANQRLIYMGRVLRDAQTLKSYDIKDGSTVHLVSSARPPNQQESPSPVNPPSMPQGQPQQPQQQPFQGMPGIFGFSNLFPPAPGQPPVQPQQGPQPQVMRFRLNPQDFFRMLQTGQVPPFMMPGGDQAGASQANPQPVPLGQQAPAGIPHQPQAVPQTTPVQPPATPQSVLPQPQTPVAQQAGRPNQPQGARNAPTGAAVQQQAPLPIQSHSTLLDAELEQATIAGNLAKVRDLIDRGANFNRGALHKACMYGHKDIVLHLVQRGAATEFKMGNGADRKSVV